MLKSSLKVGDTVKFKSAWSKGSSLKRPLYTVIWCRADLVGVIPYTAKKPKRAKYDKGMPVRLSMIEVVNEVENNYERDKIQSIPSKGN